MGEPDWHLWRAFLAVLNSGSLSGAARGLGLTQPTLGRQIAALEEAVGTPLFLRSTDGLRPTERALALAPHAAAMAAAAASLARAALASGDELNGRVRLAAGEFLGAFVLPPMLARFRRAHPAVDIDLSMADGAEDGADLAVRGAEPAQPDLLVRRIGEAPVCLFAHPAYAAAHGLPATPAETAGHTLIGRAGHERHLGALLGHELRFGLRCDSVPGLMAALLAGHGIGYCQDGAGRRARLLPVLPGLVLARVGIWLTMPEPPRATPCATLLFATLADELTRYLDLADEADA